jgi:hypothetical protein
MCCAGPGSQLIADTVESTGSTGVDGSPTSSAIVAATSSHVTSNAVSGSTIGAGVGVGV